MSKNKNTRKFSLYEYDKELAAAFKGDCEEFLEDFERLQSFNYEDFARVWQKRKFTYVFAGQIYALLLKELCENYFYIVKKFIMFPRNIYTQIGAFYMLYGLYYKQPLRNWVKIRLTLEEYKKITELIETMKTYRRNDAVYIFAKMRTDQVFHYTVLLKPLGPEDRFVKSYELYYDDTFNSSKTESSLSKIHEYLPDGKLVCDLEKTNNEYQQLLKTYSATCPSLTPFPSTLVEDLRQAYSRFAEGSLNDRELNQDPKYIKDEIKNKAMANKNAVYRGSRKVKSAVDEDLYKMDVDT